MSQKFDFTFFWRIFVPRILLTTIMKRILFTLTFALIAVVGIYAQKTVVWEKPVIGYTQYNYFTVQKVELAKDRTSIYMLITYPSEAWFRFSPQSYIEADGKRYTITGSDSIELGKEEHTSPQTWKKEFVLHFQPLPQNTKIFDMLESTQKGDFTFFYIHPDDYQMPETPVPADFLADDPEDDVLPKNVFSEEPAVVHFKALNYKKGMEAEIRTVFFDITNPNSYNNYSFNLDDEGCANFSWKVYYPTHMQFEIPSAEGSSFAILIVAPGKEVTVLLDMLRDDRYPNSKVIGYKGYMAKWMNGEFQKKVMNRMERSIIFPSFPDSYEQYKTVDDLATLHDSLMLAFDKSCAELQQIPDVVKWIYLDWESRFFYLLAEECPTLFNTQEFRDYIFRARPKCFFSDNVQVNFDLKDVMKLFAGSDVKGAGPDLLRFINAMSELTSGIVNPKPLLDDPNLSRLYDQKRQELTVKVSQQKEGLTENIHYLELAEVAPENTLQFLLDRYKGKTVFIDLWATWCQPCIMGHKEIAPVKDELKDKDIVYLYITSATSPFDTWKEMIKDIPGEHYYLSTEQFEALHNLYNTGGGVPAYAIYNANGEVTYQCLGLPRNDAGKLFKEELLKAGQTTAF